MFFEQQQNKIYIKNKTFVAEFVVMGRVPSIA
jgi:hypothetical protein